MSWSNSPLEAQHDESTLQTLFDSSPESFFLIGRSGTLLDANKTFATWRGTTLEECLGQKIELFFPQELSERLRNQAEAALESGKHTAFEDRCNTPTLLYSLYPSRSGNGECNRVLVMTRQSEPEYKQEFKKLFNNMTNGSGYCRMIFEGGKPVDFIHEEVNPDFEKLTGVSNLEGKSASEAIPGIRESHPEIFEKLGRVVEEGIVERFELDMHELHKWVEISAYSPKHGEFIAIVNDISERKRAEEALRQNEKRFRNLFENNGLVKILLDSDTGLIIDANLSAAEFYGWDRELLCRMHISQINILSPEEVKRTLEQCCSAKQNRFLFRHRRADLSVRDVEVFTSLITIEEKELIYAIIHDVTERTRLEALSGVRLRLLDIAESASLEELLRCTLDEAQRITESTIGFYHFLSDLHPLSSSQICSSNMKTELCQMNGHPGGHPSLGETGIWSRAVEEKRAIIQNEFDLNELAEQHPKNHPAIQRTLVVPVMRSNTVIAILGVGNKLHRYGDEDIRLVTALADIAWDIVARKQAESAAEKMQEALTHSQKMEMVGQLAGGIAHDFNNMLGVIIGHSEMALEQEDPTHSFHADLEAIHLAATRSADLTRQLLAFARKQTIIPKILELNLVVEGMLSMLRRLIGEEITLWWIPASHLTLVKIDPTQINQILVNFCVNARDAIAGSGNITIQTGSLHVEPQSAAPLPGMVAGDYVTLSVTDNGCGIESKDIPHIFEPFFTTKEQGKGTGLGLSTVYGIVKQNHGYIDFQSERGKESRFIIFLPRHSYQLTKKTSEPAVQNLQGDKETILLVEDEPDIMKLCKLTLENQGYSVLAVTSPHEALQRARAHQGEIHLLLTDVVMAEMNGNDLSKKLSPSCPKLKTLYMTGYTAEVIAVHGVMDEDMDFIEKPFSINGLTKKVHEMLKAEEV